MSRLISRDPFARQELHRESVKTTRDCSWCGSKRDNGTLYRYFTESDGGRRSEHSGVFCCKSCHDSYNS